MKYLLAVGGLLLVMLSPVANAADEPPVGHLITICHVAGLASDPANYLTLTIDESAVFGPGGHFFENGTTQAGHEQDTMGECNPPPPPFDQCPDIPGIQPEGTDCTPPPPVDVCPNIIGNQETVPPGFVLDDGECVPVDVTPFCAPPAVLVDGLCVVPGCTVNCTPTPPCVITGAGLDGNIPPSGNTNNNCEFLPPPVIPPRVIPPVTTPPIVPAATPPAQPPVTKPVVKPKPKPKPTRKPVAKKKPKPKPKVVAKPKPKPKTTCKPGYSYSKKYGCTYKARANG